MKHLKFLLLLSTVVKVFLNVIAGLTRNLIKAQRDGGSLCDKQTAAMTYTPNVIASPFSERSNLFYWKDCFTRASFATKVLRSNKFLSSFCLVIVMNFCSAADVDLEFKSANEAYSKGDYKKASLIYRKMIENNKSSFELFYNAGNAAYNENKLGESVLYWEKALKINSVDEDVKANLKLVNLKLIDKIENKPASIVTETLKGFSNFLTNSQWAFYSILLMIVASVLGILGIKSTSQKQKLFLSGILVFCTALIMLIGAETSYQLVIKNKEAIILSASAEAFAEPKQESSVLFNLHEGTKVKVSEIQNNWVAISLPSGAKGWMLKEALGLI